MNAERQQLAGPDADGQRWRHWGPYLSERQWGTVREDYSADGAAWEYFPHDHARSRAYRWGEDGLAGFCDDRQRLCLGLALWNGRDPILKERLFGLTGNEGNHGEDVKECYYYLDAVPSHSYLKMLYKYPQRAFPYAELVEVNGRRGRDEDEYELLDTGIFDGNRYFDVFIEYAKADPEDVLLRIAVHNRGPEAAPLDLLVQIWFRNTWTWTGSAPPGRLEQRDDRGIRARHPRLGEYVLCAPDADEGLFCENHTNVRRLYGWDKPGPFKDAFHEYIVHGDSHALAGAPSGTKAALRFRRTIVAGGGEVFRARLSRPADGAPEADFDTLVARRRTEADAFYAELQQHIDCPERRAVQRQALAGMIWNQQFYRYRVRTWLDGDPAMPPPPPGRRHVRNVHWQHLDNAEILSMPDKWEYPWYAAWDLAFHCIPLALVDPGLAKQQLLTLGHVWYQHPNGQVPAYEWNFGDVNPPVQAWAAWRVFQMDRAHFRSDTGDLGFLERMFHKLLLNFT